MWQDTEPPTRTCPECGRQEQTRFERCPHCGASYFGRSSAHHRRRKRAVAGGLAVVAVAAAAGIALLLAEASDREKRDRADRARAVVTLRAELARTQAPHRGAATDLKPVRGASRAEQLQARKALLGAATAAITADARRREATGELDGPISHTECGPIERRADAVPDHEALTKKLGRYDCVAVKADVRQHGRSVGRLGHPFVTTLDFTAYRFTWCRNTPAQSERGQALVFVRLERACLGAKGRALGTGYVDVPQE